MYTGGRMDGFSDPLDDEIELGDGTSDTPVEVSCPYCGEPSQVHVDPAGGTDQTYVEDCEVCCRPMEIRVRYTGGVPHVEAATEDDGGL